MATVEKMDKKSSQIFTDSGFRVCIVLLFAFTVPAFFLENKLFFIIELVLACGMIFFQRIALSKRRRALDKYIKASVINQENLSGSLMLSFPLPMAVVLMENKSIVWANERFTDMVQNTHIFDRPFTDACPDLPLNWVTEGGSMYANDVVFGGRTFSVSGNLFTLESTGVRGLMAVLYFTDLTELRAANLELADNRTVIADIVWDNYEEVAKNAGDSVRSSLVAQLDAAVHGWVSAEGGIMRKSERDRFLLIFTEKAYATFAEKSFDLLNRVMEIAAPGGMPVTISIGVGRGGATLGENMQAARMASEMALSRGGNQAVVRTGTHFEFFGGRSVETERRSQVRSRIMANVLKDLINDSSNVIIMSHRVADPDSVGAAAGVARMCMECGKNFYIVLDRNRCGCPRIVDMLAARPEYENAFTDAQSALVIGNSRSLLVVVDTSRRDYTEAPELIDSFPRIAVIDHHRRSAGYISNAAVNIQETVASSTCEMICEMLQYTVAADHITPAEATAMLAGIILDTRGFTVKCGARAFEAAAFLRRVGADTVGAKQAFQGSAKDYLEKTRLSATAETYRDKYIIAVTTDETDRAVAAQAADNLLDIYGILASFSVFVCAGEVCVSGRSLGQVNVQLILEWMGGGGQITSAGAQLRGRTVDEVVAELKTNIDRYIESNTTAN